MKKKSLMFMGIFLLFIFAVVFFSIERNGELESEFDSDVDNPMNNDSDISDVDIDIRTKTLDFINTTLSDFATENTYQDYLIDERATIFKQFLEDKREIANIKQSISGSWTMADSEVRTFSIELLDNNIYEVICEIYYEVHTENGIEPAFLVEGYKLLVSDKGGEFKVLAAMFNGLSATPLFPINVSIPTKDFDLSIFINDDFTAKSEVDMPYDFEQIKTELLDELSDFDQER